MELRITDGTTTITLNPAVGALGAATIATNGYRPQTPPEEHVLAVDLTRDGGELSASSWRNIEDESAWVTFTGPVEAARLAIQQLEGLFRQAREQQQLGIGARVYLELRIAEGEDWWRSEILSGWVELGPRALTTDWLNAQIEATIHWARRYYWEGPETPLAMTNVANPDAPTTDPLTVYNCNLPGASNYLDIAGADVLGTLPAPVRLNIHNHPGADAQVAYLWTCLNARSSPASFQHYYEGEGAAGAYLTPRVTSNASGGMDAKLEWATTDWILAADFGLSSGQLLAAGGNWFRVLGCLKHNYTSLYARLRVQYQGITIYQSDPVLLHPIRDLAELGTVQLPPWLLGAGTPAALALYLDLRETAHGTSTRLAYLDFIQLSPLDGFRLYRPRGTSKILSGQTLVDDGVNGHLYVDTGAGVAGHYLADGEPLLLLPGMDHRLYMLWTTNNGDHDYSLWVNVTASYRPRRLTI